RADVYSLAATVYHALAGEPPPSPLERISGFAGGAPVVLRPGDQLHSGVPARVALALQHALAVRLEDRMETAEALRDALRLAGATQPRADGAGSARAPQTRGE